MRTIRVVVADDHHVVRAAVASFLDREPDIEVVGEVDNARSLPAVVRQQEPDVLILDAHMPGQNVTHTARTLDEQYPQVEILVLSAFDRREYVVGFLRAGAKGYVLKDDTPEMLVQAVRKVSDGQEYLSPRVLNTLMQSVREQGAQPFDQLTKRELEVLRLMAKGMRNEEIADALVITQQTVKNHIRHIFGKLGVDTRVDAVLYAIDNKLDSVMENESASR